MPHSAARISAAWKTSNNVEYRHVNTDSGQVRGWFERCPAGAMKFLGRNEAEAIANAEDAANHQADFEQRQAEAASS